MNSSSGGHMLVISLYNPACLNNFLGQVLANPAGRNSNQAAEGGCVR